MIGLGPLELIILMVVGAGMLLAVIVTLAVIFVAMASRKPRQ